MSGEMLDPSWTPEAAYSHADGLLAILAKHDAEKRRLAEEEIEIDE